MKRDVRTADFGEAKKVAVNAAGGSLVGGEVEVTSRCPLAGFAYSRRQRPRAGLSCWDRRPRRGKDSTQLGRNVAANANGGDAGSLAEQARREVTSRCLLADYVYVSAARAVLGAGWPIAAARDDYASLGGTGRRTAKGLDTLGSGRS